MSGDELARDIAKALCAYANAYGEQGAFVREHAMGLAQTVLTVAPPPAQVDERVRQLRGMADGIAPRSLATAQLMREAADLLESTAARLAASDAIIAEYVSAAKSCAWPVFIDDELKEHDAALARHAARASRAGKGETR